MANREDKGVLFRLSPPFCIRLLVCAISSFSFSRIPCVCFCNCMPSPCSLSVTSPSLPLSLLFSSLILTSLFLFLVSFSHRLSLFLTFPFLPLFILSIVALFLIHPFTISPPIHFNWYLFLPYLLSLFSLFSPSSHHPFPYFLSLSSVPLLLFSSPKPSLVGPPPCVVLCCVVSP